MEKLFADLGSVYWWVSVVIVGLALNIISSFGFKYLDRFVYKFSTRQKEKQKQQIIDDEKMIEELKKSDLDKIIQCSYVLYLRLQSIIYLLVAIMYFNLISFFYLSTTGKISEWNLKLISLAIFLVMSYILFRAMRFLRMSHKENELLFKSRTTK